MELTLKQEAAVRLAVARYIAKEKYTVIAGPAGTGKTTLVQYIISALNLYPEQVAYIAYTGKAASVLQQKGCPNAMTAHKLLYKSIALPNGGFKFLPRRPLEKGYKCIVIDEVSMLPKDMWELLLSHNVYIIACGDNEQLPPINPEEDNHVLDNPNIYLDEIMRQAYDSEIIRLATFIRQGGELEDYKGDNEECLVLPKAELSGNMLVWADQVLCATNQVRTQMNQEIRTLLGFASNEPEPGDKIISLRNHWDLVSYTNPELPLTNGTLLTIDDYRKQTIQVPKYIYADRIIPIMITAATSDDFGEKFNNLIIDYNSIVKGTKTLDNRQEYMMAKARNLMDPPLEFAYGYALTCHKAQGSQWNKILVIEESFPFDYDMHRRWLYTAITRAVDKLVLIKK